MIAADTVHEIEIARSRFRCALVRVGDVDAATAVIEAIRREHWTATHHCTALRIGSDGGRTQRSNDDGEPAGTAGVPMLEVLSRREITDVVAVVSRWFGGTKLGAGGLVRAYGQAVSESLDAAGTLRRVRHRQLLVAVGHEEAGRLENALRTDGHRVADVHHGPDVTITVDVPEDGTDAFAHWLAERTAGTIEAVDAGPRDLYLP
ncbi:putative YigZ family protein [Pseudonocardia endophytica]|uniref:Putative YigZ family protein n=2 Tax=Pseudonocardia endophytica TaxID=401976 RepID=A0A4R1HR94_PSEEN|nr:putative YigZ family protein [Pseudonocardia endophytica]